MAQALILCTLPYRPTEERQVVRSARLSDGSTLRVTFTAGITGVELAFGNDRQLMAWLFDKAINSDTSFVTIKSASEVPPRDRKEAQWRPGQGARGAVKTIDRLGNRDREAGFWNHPDCNASHDRGLKSASQSHGAARGREQRPGKHPWAREPFWNPARGAFLSGHQASSRRHSTAPVDAVAGAEGWSTVTGSADIFVYRCYCAQSETVIPWAGLREQFPQNDSNPRRLKQNVKKAIKQLRILWPEVRIDVLKEGVWVNKAVMPLLPDDPTKKRVRRLDLVN